MTGASYKLVPWTLAALIVATLPHVFKMPLQITLFIASIYISRAFIHFRFRRMPKQWIKIILIILAFSIVLATFHTINGAQAGGALLLCIVAIKTLEMNSLRDHAVLILATFFIITSFLLDNTSIWSGLYLLPAITACIFALLKISAPSLDWKTLLPSAKQFMLYGLPITILLFVLFPRIPGPLWGLPNATSGAKTGLGDSMSPGSITDLVKSDELAFRVKFDGREPQRNELYWRGPVLHNFDGKNWSMADVPIERRSEQNTMFNNPNDLAYEVILEAHNQRWLLTLDHPRVLPKNSVMLEDFQVGQIKPVSQMLRYTATANLSISNGFETNKKLLQLALALPEKNSKRTKDLAQQWRADNKTETEIVNAALSLFNKELFSYTLSPQALDMSNPVDDFLFRTREGFCEHYASAFVVLMRSAGIPARVVTGYLGGEKNYLNGYYLVKQSDAHAWSEVYLQDRGWTRVDPTSAIAPERIEQDLQSTFPDVNFGGLFSGAPFMLRLESAWFAVNTAWFEWVLDFDAEKQMNLLSKLGFAKPNWQSLIWLLVGGIVSVTLFMSFQMWLQSRKIFSDPLQKLYFQFSNKLEKKGIHKSIGIGPHDFSEEAILQAPELENIISQFIEIYIEARYYAKSSISEAVPTLKKLLKQL